MRCPVADPGKEPDTPSLSDEASAFLHDLCGWREQLARSIARNNIGMRSAEIALAVHRTLSRLALLAIAKDRHLISPGTSAGSLMQKRAIPGWRNFSQTPVISG